MRKLIMGLAVSSMILTACNPEPEVTMTVPATANVGENVVMANGSDVKKTYNANWSFGDGGTASTWDANHIYSEAGSYTVTLTATNKKGNMATSATQVITVSDNGIGAIETKMEEEAVAMDEWWTKAVGTYSFGTGSINYNYCGTNSTDLTLKSRATAVKVTIITPNGDFEVASYMMNENGEKNNYTFEYIDETHVRVGALRFLYTPATGSAEVNDHAVMTSGIYTYANTGSVITLTRIEENIDNNGGDPCVDRVTYTYTLTK